MKQEYITALVWLLYLAKTGFSTSIDTGLFYILDVCLKDKSLITVVENETFYRNIPSLLQCGSICKTKKDDCLSFFFNNVTGTCTISKQYFIQDSDTKTDTGTTFYKRTGITIYFKKTKKKKPFRLVGLSLSTFTGFFTSERE